MTLLKFKSASPRKSIYNAEQRDANKCFHPLRFQIYICKVTNLPIDGEK